MQEIIHSSRKSPLREIYDGAIDESLSQSLKKKTGKGEAIRGIGFFN